MKPTLAVLAAGLMVAAAGWIALLLARRGWRNDPPWLRSAAAVVVGFGLSHTVLELLLTLHGFRLWVALSVWSAAAVAAHVALDGRGAVASLTMDARAAARLALDFVRAPVCGLLVAGAAIVVGARAVLGALAPPLGWDALLYHAFKPARWVQYGYRFRELAPDQWGYYEYFPEAGHGPAAWAMLATGDDGLFALAGVLVWAASAPVSYAAARALGGRRIPSAFAAFAIGFVPAMASEMVSGYGDTFTLLTFMFAALGLIEMAREPGRRAGFLLGVGCGLLIASKTSGLALGGATYAAAAALALARRREGRRSALAGLAVAALMAGALALPGLLNTFLATGSPLYPFTLKVGGHVLLPGNEELQEVLRATASAGGGNPVTFGFFVGVLLVPLLGSDQEHLGFGPGFVLLAIQGIAGLVWMLRRLQRPPTLRATALALLLLGGLPATALLSDDLAAQRTLWIGVVGRLILPLPAMLAVLAAQRDGRPSRVAWILLLAIDLVVIGFPGGFAPEIGRALRALLPSLLLAIAAGAAAAFGLARLRRRHPVPGLGPAVPALALAVFAAVVANPWWRVRADSRYPIYEAAARHDEPAFVMHRLDPRMASAWPIWRRLDEAAPHRVALAVGWDGLGHNAFRYPLTGSRLQNEVLYVPVTADGSVVDYRLAEPLRSRADEAAWLRRLVDRGIDTVVTLAPDPIERGWILNRPLAFEEIAASADGLHHAYRVRRIR